MFKILYITQLAETGRFDSSVYDGFSEGLEDSDWFQARLAELGLADRVDITSIDVCRGEAIPRSPDFDAVILGGSVHMVSEQREWQLRILDWLGYWRQQAKPLFGICGGHQLMGHFHGGAVVPLKSGTWAATKQVTPLPEAKEHWLFEDLGGGFAALFGNSEHLDQVPKGSRLLLAHEDSPAVALDFGGNWVSVQFHPEMSREGFQRSWRIEAPERMQHYTDAPDAPLLLRNFLKRAGLQT